MVNRFFLLKKYTYKVTFCFFCGAEDGTRALGIQASIPSLSYTPALICLTFYFFPPANSNMEPINGIVPNVFSHIVGGEMTVLA
jgi:hypothetical protein